VFAAKALPASEQRTVPEHAREVKNERIRFVAEY
jgi:hypothetical protein